MARQPSAEQRCEQRRAGRRLVRERQQLRRSGRYVAIVPAIAPIVAAGTATNRASSAWVSARCAREAPTARRTPIARKPPLNLRPADAAEHHRRRGERDHRQRDEQIDHDPRCLVEQDPQPRAGHEPHAVEPIAVARAWTSTSLTLRRVAQPDLREVDARVELGAAASVPARRATRRCAAPRADSATLSGLSANPTTRTGPSPPMNSVPPRRIPHADARPRSTTTSPLAAESGRGRRRSRIRGGRYRSPPPTRCRCCARWRSRSSTPVYSWRSENAARSGSASIRCATVPACCGSKRTITSGRSAALAARSKPRPSPSATTIAAASIAAASAIPSAVSSDRRLRSAHAVAGLCQRCSQADSLSAAARVAVAASSRPSRRCSTRSAIAAASGSWVTITTARARGCAAAQHGGAVVLVEVAGRLVGENELGVVDERACDRQTLLLAARQLVRAPVGDLREPSSPISRRARSSPPRRAPGGAPAGARSPRRSAPRSAETTGTRSRRGAAGSRASAREDWPVSSAAGEHDPASSRADRVRRAGAATSTCRCPIAPGPRPPRRPRRRGRRRRGPAGRHVRRPPSS